MLDDGMQSTFRGSAGGTMLRSTLYFKTEGRVRDCNSGLRRVSSPISGNQLILPLSRQQRGVKDPISGTPLGFTGDCASINTWVQKQGFAYSKKFYISKDIDITLQTLRATTKTSKFTNEKVGTAGSSTGMDNSLRAYKELQGQMAKQRQGASPEPSAAY